jgi:hypothetical protein
VCAPSVLYSLSFVFSFLCRPYFFPSLALLSCMAGWLDNHLSRCAQGGNVLSCLLSVLAQRSLVAHTETRRVSPLTKTSFIQLCSDEMCLHPKQTEDNAEQMTAVDV